MYSIVIAAVALLISASLQVSAQSQTWAFNYFNTTDCSSSGAVAVISTPSTSCSLTSSCTALALTGSKLYNTATCSTKSSKDYAASVFGKTNYAGVITYSDTACTTEIAAQYIVADGSCVATSSATSYQVTISGGKASYSLFPSKDCSGTAVTVPSFGNTACIAGQLSGTVLSINGAYSAATPTRSAPAFAVLAVAVLAAVFMA